VVPRVTVHPNHFTPFTYRSLWNDFSFWPRTVIVNNFEVVDAYPAGTLLAVLIAWLSVLPGCPANPAISGHAQALVSQLWPRTLRA